MKRIISIVLALVLSISCGAMFVSAAEAEKMSLMPLDFYFTTTYRVPTGTDFPPGWVTYQITIAGVYDINRDNIMSIDTISCKYTGGVNCTSQDMKLVAQKNSNNSAYVNWYLQGTASFSWTSPVTGMTYSTTIYDAPLQTFNAKDYT